MTAGAGTRRLEHSRHPKAPACVCQDGNSLSRPKHRRGLPSRPAIGIHKDEERNRMAGTHLTLFIWVLLPGWKFSLVILETLSASPACEGVRGPTPSRTLGQAHCPDAEVPARMGSSAQQPVRSGPQGRGSPRQSRNPVPSGASLHSHSPHGSCRIPVRLMSSRAESSLLQGWWTPSSLPGRAIAPLSLVALAANSLPPACTPTPAGFGRTQARDGDHLWALCFLPGCSPP